MLKQELNRVVSEIQEKHKDFEHITLHTYKYTSATRCIENGMPPQVLIPY